MGNADIKIDNLTVTPINCKEIILGDRRQTINPLTGEVIHENTSGTYLYRINEHRNKGYFLLAYESSRIVRN